MYPGGNNVWCSLDSPTSYTAGTWSYSTVKRPGRGADYPRTSGAEVANGLELYVGLPSVPT
jgi:hypothetical protein